jgi:nitric oxide reductase subunit C
MAFTFDMHGIRRFFMFACVLATVLMIVALAGALQSHDVPPEAVAGYTTWRANGCEGCHTLFGQGGPYAPDLTHSFSQRGENYLREFLVDPGAFYPGQRVMPRFGLTRTEIDDLLAFLQWVDQQNTMWPPRPILVSGDSNLNAQISTDAGEAELLADPVERGRHWFSRPPAICATCHSLEPAVVIVGPSLAGIATRAAMRVPGQSAETYLRKSILDPGDYIVEGFPDAMVRNLGQQLTSDQINDLIAYLITLE